MSNQSIGLESGLYEYLLSVSLREHPVLAELRQETTNHVMGQMQISPEQGQLMALLIKLTNAQRALEVGVFTGYSALAVALALPPTGRLVACDVSEDYTAIAQPYWQKAGVADKIDLRLAPATDTLQQLINVGETDTFDFVFIDADKSNYDTYYEQALQLVRTGGLIAIDNVLWYGRVADATVTDNRTQKIRALNQKLFEDERIDLSLLPVGDGLTLARKR
ncbi:MAG: SAM-dependent methyltransferase [Leptolyngbya sp. SIOISBB]|nr:SAM-dependent methyltransferase [Leptolyngbya sp. SIOISBB]